MLRFTMLAAMASLLVPIITAVEVEKEEGVVVLTDDNFDEVIAAHEHVLVKFYAPWCGHCKAMAPEYAKAAETLAAEGSAIVLAKLDAVAQTKKAAEYQVQGYPTVKFFIKGTPMEFNGERVASKIVDWVKKKSGPPAVAIADVDQLSSLRSAHSVLVVAIVNDEASTFGVNYLKVAASPSDESVHYAIIKTDAANIDALLAECKLDNKDDTVVIFKDFDDELGTLAAQTDEAGLRAFIAENSLPAVVEFNQQTAQRIFGGAITTHLIMFASYGDADKYQDLKKQAAKVAGEFKGKIIFVTIDVDEPDHERISEFFGMSKDNPTGMRIIKLAEEMAKFRPDVDELSEASIRSFVTDFFDGKIKQHLLTEEIPDDWDAKPVKVLVGKNFKDVAYQKDKHVIIKFYAPWCGHCKALAPVWDELGEKFTDRDDVVVAKLDSTANELEDVKVSGFPTIKLFKKETNDVIDYNGERTLEGLAKFIESDGLDGAAVDDADADEEDADYDDEEDEEDKGKEEL